MKVAIAGATGLTGSICLELLLQDDRITQVYAIGRRSTGISHPKLQEVKLDNGQLTTAPPADAFICCLGTTIKKAGSRDAFEAIDWHLPVHLARALHTNGCRKAAVVSAMFANADSRIFYNRVKGKMEEAMQQVGFSAVHLLRPSMITGPRQEKRAGEKLALLLSKMLDPFLKGRLRHMHSIPAHTIARGLIQAILSPAQGNYIYLSDDIKLLAAS